MIRRIPWALHSSTRAFASTESRVAPVGLDGEARTTARVRGLMWWAMSAAQPEKLPSRSATGTGRAPRRAAMAGYAG